MSAKCFVDTNILVYAHDASAGPKHERARALVVQLWQTRAGVVSTQVLQELCVNVRKKAAQPLDIQETRDLVSDYLAWHVVVNDGDAILAALEIRAAVQGLFLGCPRHPRGAVGRGRRALLGGLVRRPLLR